MPQAGEVTIKVSPFDAALIADWLRRDHEEEPHGLLGSETPDEVAASPNRAQLAAKFGSIARRQRAEPVWKQVRVVLQREDAIWLAARAPRPRSMFGAARRNLPDAAAALCFQCAEALAKRRGRRTLKGQALATTVYGRAIDPRHRQRLSARLKREQAEREMWASYDGTLCSEMAKALAKMPPN